MVASKKDLKCRKSFEANGWQNGKKTSQSESVVPRWASDPVRSKGPIPPISRGPNNSMGNPFTVGHGAGLS